MTISIKIEGNPGLTIERAVKRLFSRSAMGKYGRTVRKHTRERIREGIDTSGQPFTFLSDAYEASKKGPGILRETGALFSTLFVEGRRGEAEVGTRLDYGTYNQKGVPERNLPEREWLSITNQDLDVIGEQADDIWEDAFIGR